MRCPIIINCRDRLTPLASLVEWLETAGQEEIYLLDNDSTYPSLLDYYEKTPHEVIRLGENLGHRALWLSDRLSKRLSTADHYVYSDPDIVPIPECPPDALDFFAGILDRNPLASKVGFGLRIDDLPDHYRFKDEVIRWERQFWTDAIAPGLYRAPIDTTFALYRGSSGHDLDRAIRTGYPYLARHTAWYVNTENPGEEEEYYRGRARRDTTHWNAEELPSYLLERIAQSGAESEMPLGVQPDAGVLTWAWDREPPLQNEDQFTPWAKSGWMSWNGMSPESEFCELAGLLTRFLEPEIVIETGTGQGFVTRRVAPALRGDQQLIAYESDSVLRSALKKLPFFDQPGREVADLPRPGPEDFAKARFSVLDSDFPDRVQEIESWVNGAAPGSVVLLHDCGNGHHPGAGHDQLRELIAHFQIPGLFLENPRGSFLGIKIEPSSDERRALEEELARIKNSRSYRYTEPARQVRRLAGRLAKGRPFAPWK